MVASRKILTEAITIQAKHSKSISLNLTDKSEDDSSANKKQPINFELQLENCTKENSIESLNRFPKYIAKYKFVGQKVR